MSGFKAGAPAHRRWIVSPSEWCQDLDGMFSVFFGSLFTSVFSCFQGGHVAPSEEPKLVFSDTLPGSLPAKILDF